MSKIAVFRLRGLDQELAAILQEADGRCSTTFALRVDSLRERLQGPITAAMRSEARIIRKHCDKDAKDNPVQDDRGTFKFTSAEQQEALSDSMTEFLQTDIDIPDDLQKLTKRELVGNGLGVGGMRIANLRPILDTAVDEPEARGGSDRTVFITDTPRGIPHA